MKESLCELMGLFSSSVVGRNSMLHFVQDVKMKFKNATQSSEKSEKLCDNKYRKLHTKKFFVISPTARLK